MRVRIGSRSSDLARLQAYLVGEQLKISWPEVEIDYQFKESLGDKNLTDPLWKAPEKGVFTEDFYKDLVDGTCDVVVHSWKDLPIVEKPETFIAATLERADARDILLLKKQSKERQLSDLTILSSSPRRAYNLTPFFSWSLPWKVDAVRMESVRGNIPTRIRKLIESQADGLIVAKAALDRLMTAPFSEFEGVQNQLRACLDHLTFQVIPHSVNPPCAGQGALALEVRRSDTRVLEILSKIHFKRTFQDVENERKILQSYGGGCHQKIGVWNAQKEFGRIQILKGLTEAGEILNSQKIESPILPPRFPNEKLISLAAELEILRRPIRVAPPDVDGWIVARADALPRTWTTDDRYIWSAGTQTWRKLSSEGVWVHGSFDGLGEEPIDLKFLSHPVSWAKLTHSGSSSNIFPSVATYEVSGPAPQSIDSSAFYFWRSLSHFERVLDRHPSLLHAWHACGPGATYQGLKNRVNREKLFAFFNEQDWRNQCRE